MFKNIFVGLLLLVVMASAAPGFEIVRDREGCRDLSGSNFYACQTSMGLGEPYRYTTLRFSDQCDSLIDAPVQESCRQGVVRKGAFVASASWLQNGDSSKVWAVADPALQQARQLEVLTRIDRSSRRSAKVLTIYMAITTTAAVLVAAAWIFAGVSYGLSNR